ncbi:N-acetylglucosamine kinase [Wenjunlia tyrosinilytica]|nr:BadF/BadG/BcrA/BcrD ATPase family protein [Wenjunlia tyrosinilytica]
MPPTPLLPRGVLAVDAGNSKTDVALVAPDGSLLGTARGGGFQPHETGPEAAVATLVPLVTSAAAQAGLAVSRAVPLVEHVSACLANADLPIEEQRLEQAIRRHGWGRTARVANDTFALLRAGVEEPRGVAVVCGAGINCAGLLPDGRTARFPALGKISGDWGGGGHLAEEAMWWAARAEDGRGPGTSLATAMPRHFGLTSMQHLIEALHLGEIASVRRHELTPVLFEEAEGGDPVSVALIHRQAEEIVALAVVALRRLDMLDGPADVVLGGGVLAARRPLLMSAVEELLKERAPHAVTRVVTTPPVVGAALLGLDHTEATPAARGRLRTAYESGLTA